MDQGTESAAPAAHGSAFDARLQPPTPRPGIVARTALVDRMLRHHVEQVVSVVAPAGYGKTTVLAQWAARLGRDVAWVSVDETDNDPSRLLASIATALSGVRHLDPRTVAEVVARSGTVPNALTRLTPSPSSTDRSFVLVLDHIEAIDDPESLDVIAGIAWRLPAGSRLAVASRSQPPIPTPVLRSRANLVEVGVDDLAMDTGEARALLEACGVVLGADAIADLVGQTEGWPVGIYLAALAAKADGATADNALAFTGNDMLMADYIRDQVLATLPPATVSFLTRTSVLDHLSAPLCDAVLDSTCSHRMLEALAASNLLLVPLDRERRWYRYHRLLRDLLSADLQANEADLIPVLHRRAARWLEAHDMPDMAIAHAQLGDDADHAARLVAVNAQPAFAAGRASVARRWFEWFRTEGRVDDFPQIPVLGAWIEALGGRAASAEQWTAIAEAGPTEGALPDGSRIEGWLAYLRAVLCRNGPARMRADARQALDLLPPDSRLRAGVRVFEGLSHALDGDVDAADEVFLHAYDMAMHTDALPSATTAAAQRALIAIDRHAWDDARVHLERARDLVDAVHLEDYLGSGFVYAAAARLAIHDGDTSSAGEQVTAAARLRPLCTYALPASSLIQLELARLYIELDDPLGARTVLAELRDTLRMRPDLGIVPAAADHLSALVGTGHDRSQGPSTLTKAELRLVPYLGTHLSFREIGERLSISHHTVKTQAIAVYRKLGVSSRSEAVDRLQSSGLLGR